MTEIRLRFDLAFSRRFITLAGAGVIMLCAVPELDSESVTLSTYYPAPSGVYTNMITTGNTFLARDGGAVALGTVTPVGGSKLTVTGGSIAGSFGIVPNYVNWNTYGTGAGGAAIYNSNEAAYQALMLVGNNSGGGGVRRVKVWDEMTVNGNSITNGNESISGSVSANGHLKTRAGAACTVHSHQYGAPNGGTTALCAGNRYVTTTAGLFAKYIAMPLDRGAQMSPAANNQFNYICCPCPPSGCTDM